MPIPKSLILCGCLLAPVTAGGLFMGRQGVNQLNHHAPSLRDGSSRALSRSRPLIYFSRPSYRSSRSSYSGGGFSFGK